MSEPAHRTQLGKAPIESIVGTTNEWYDFLLYSVVTGLVFGKLFFPASDPLVGVLQAFSVYTVNQPRHLGRAGLIAVPAMTT